MTHVMIGKPPYIECRNNYHANTSKLTMPALKIMFELHVYKSEFCIVFIHLRKASTVTIVHLNTAAARL